MDAFVEITKKLGSAFGCSNTDTLIPEFFRRYKSEQKNINVLENIFRKRK